MRNAAAAKTEITVHFKAQMTDGIKTIWSGTFSAQSNTERQRCIALHKAYPLAQAAGVHVEACHHAFTCNSERGTRG